MLESFEEYEFNACQKYNKEDDFKYFISCLDGEVIINDDLSKLQKDIQAVNLSYFKQNFLDHLKEDSLETLNEQKKNIQKITACLESKNKSNECIVLEDNLESTTRQDLKEMRHLLSLSKAPSFFNSSKNEIFSRKIEHPIKDTKIPELSKIEKKEISERESFVNYSLTQKWLIENAKDSKCIEKLENGQYQLSKKFQGRYSCQNRYAAKLQNYKEKNIEEIRTQASREYFKIVNKTPLLASLSLSGEESKEIILKEYTKKLKEISQSINKSIEKINKLKSNELYSLISNKNIVENYLERQGPPEFLCDIAQDYKDKVFYDELKTDLFVAGGAIVGGGICGLTAGLGCVIGAAITAEAVSIGLSHSRNENEELLFNSGLSEGLKLSEREDDLTLTLAIAPLALGGEFLGKGIKQGVKALKGSKATAHEAIHTSDLLTNYQKSKFFEHSANAVSKPKSVTDLIFEYEHFNLTTPALNRNWIKSAKANDSAFFLDVENAALKRLNDTLGDKSFVTALTNIHKDIFSKKVFEILKKYPEINFDIYSDFKSVRFAFSPKNIPAKLEKELMKDLNNAYAKTNDEFAIMMRDISNLPITEQPEKWFAAGISKSADEAGLASKKSRNLDRSLNKITTFDEVKGLLKADVEDISNMQLKMSKNERLIGANVISEISGTKHFTLSEDFIDLIRKTPKESTPEKILELQTKIQTQYNLKLSTAEVSELGNYVHKLGELTPGLWNEVREVANLDKAIYGGITGDVTGMGSTNIRQIALDIAHVGQRATPEEVLAKIRLGEENVTKEFNRIKKNFEGTMRELLQKRGIAHDIKCSGDDCAVVINQVIDLVDQQDIIKTFASQPNPSQYRMSFVPANAPIKGQTNIAVHGEMVEKELRQSLRGFGETYIKPDILKRICFGISMPNSPKAGNIDLVMASARDLNLTPNQIELITLKFKKAVEKVNLQLSDNNVQTALYTAHKTTYAK